MSVPVIRYHASDDELEELYPSTDDDEKQLTPESEKPSPGSSPRKSSRTCISVPGSGEVCEGSLVDRRSTSMDENLSEGTPPSADPWKVLSEIKGKITKTFEEKLHEITIERKKSKHDRSRDNSSVSDYEDLGDVTPTEELNGSDDKQEKNLASRVLLRKRTRSSRFGGFSYIKTGLKDNKLAAAAVAAAGAAEEDGVESGIEAAELTCECQSKVVDSSFVLNEKSQKSIGNVLARLQKIIKYFLPAEMFKSSNTAILTESDYLFIQLKNRIYTRIVVLVIVLCSCYFIPLPKYFMGIWAGIFVSFMVQGIYTTINTLLTIPVESCRVPVLEIPAVEEHAVVEKFEGWLNELPYCYEPDNYHVARTKPVFFKLEGEVLQVMETRTRIPKRAIWDEAKHEPKFTKKRAYSLAGAKVELLPSGLIRRR